MTSISQTTNDCLPATIYLTATYLDADDNPICSGTVPNLFESKIDPRFPLRFGHVDVFHLDVKPTNILEFVRWKNAPVPTPSMTPPRRLICLNLEGLAETPAQEILRAATLKLHATVLPRTSGVATAETRLTLIARPN